MGNAIDHLPLSAKDRDVIGKNPFKLDYNSWFQ